MTTTRRAMRDDQKQERRQNIRDIAWQLFQTTAYSEIAMNMVAQQAGLAKGTLYLYFKTKEDLFLSVQEQQFGRWFDDLDACFLAAQSTDSITLITAQLGDSLEVRPGMNRLLAILHSVLEQNIDYNTALHLSRCSTPASSGRRH